MAQHKTGLMVNIDINSVLTPFLNKTAQIENATEADYYPFVDVYTGTQVTDLLFCTFCQFSLTPSKIFTDAVTKFHQTVENGEPVNYYDRYIGHKVAWEDRGIDPVTVWLRRTREKGMRAWISLRMNDCHEPDDKACFLRSDFFYEAREKGWMIGSHYGYFRNCFNYAVPEVRKKMLAYIDEQLMQYSNQMDGLELDFEREIYCFDYLNCPDAVEIMTAFVADVKALVTAAEGRVGHPIELSVRLGREMEQNRVFGFDAKRLVEVGVQRIIVTPRWQTADSDMPIDSWCRELPATPITAGIEFLVNRVRDESCGTPAVVRAYAAHYLAQGSDGIYLYNYFLNPYDKGSAGFENHHGIHATCYGPAVAQEERLFIVTYQDIAPEGYPAWRPLPATLGSEPWNYQFRAGVAPAEKTEVIVGLDKDADIAALHLAVDGTPVTAYRTTDAGQIFAPDDVALFAMSVPKTVFAGKTDMNLAFTADKPMNLHFLAIDCL